jgi:hypothetical protein
MPQAIPAVIGAGASLLGAKKAKKSADADRAQQQAVIDRLAEVDFDPQSLFGPSGVGFDFDTGVGSLGEWAPFQDALGGLADMGIGQGSDIQQSILDMGLGDLFGTFGQAGSLKDMAFADIMGGGSQQDANFLKDVFGQGIDFAGSELGKSFAEGRDIRAGAADLGALGDTFLNEASGGFDNIRAETLDLLRERDREGEDRAAAGLADQLFGTGRLGTTGGGRQISDFAQGLARADLDRQLAATGEARAVQRQQADIGTQIRNLVPGLINAGTGVSGLEQIPMRGLSDFGSNFGMATELGDAMLNNAFNRFGSTAGLTNDMFGNIFNLGTNLIGQGTDALGTAMGMENFPLEWARFAANLGATDVNTQIAAAGGQGDVAANFGPSGNDLMATALSSLGGNLFESAGGWDTIGSTIGGLFKKNEPVPSGKG